MSFKKDFVWGAAASSYQIEGAWDEDGKGLSIWDMLTRQPGRIVDNGNGNIACDHYHRYKEDVELMGEIGLRAYRFSVCWPRVVPGGTGAVNPAGLDFYDRLVDGLLAKNIDPWVTLYHWEFPYDLFLRGGWLSPDSPKWFADYTAVVVDRLSDRVTNWLTLNEPQIFISYGYLGADFEHAPSLKVGMTEGLLAAHHTLLAHGMSVQTIRARAHKTPRIGWAPVGVISWPATESPEDIAAARASTHGVCAGDKLMNNRWWGDPVVFGHYPEEGLQAYGKVVPKFKSSDFDIIRQPLDYYGMNTYYGDPVMATPDGGHAMAPMPQGYPQTLCYWKQTPEVLYWGPRFLAEHFKLPVVITENGLSNSDSVSLDGKVHDPQRIDFLNRYLLALQRAAREGVDVRAYFQWSVMDNFEWASGYRHRFGLIHVDYETQKRTLKDSSHWYREVIRTNGASLQPAL